VSRSLKAHLLLLAATLVWGATFIVIKAALADASPLVFNAVRMVLAAVLLLVIFRHRLRSMTVGVWRAGFTIGTLMWLGYEFQTDGLLYTSASKSAFLTGVSVVLVPILLALFWRGHVNRYTLGGVMAACVGLYLLCIPAGQGLSLASLNRGDILTLGCAVAFAFQIIAVGRSAQHYDFAHLVTIEIAVCAAWMLISIPFERHAYLRLTPRLLVALAITSIVGTVGCFIVQAWAQRFTPPTHTALIFSLEPVFAGLTSYAVLGERLGARAIVGAALILAGVLASEVLGQVQVPEAEISDELGEEAI
jgi:drug/metabolite transporter (DMT)-like permease